MMRRAFRVGLCVGVMLAGAVAAQAQTTKKKTENSAQRQAADEGLQTLVGHTDGITALAFSPDGKLLASGSADQTVIVWDTATGKMLQHLDDFRGRITALSFSRDGKHLLSAAYEPAALVWNTQTWKIEDLVLPSRSVMGGEFLDAQRFVVHAKDAVEIWSLGQDQPEARVRVQEPIMNDLVRGFLVTKDGLITSNDEADLEVWSLPSGQRVEGYSRPEIDPIPGVGAANKVDAILEKANGHLIFSDSSGTWEWDRKAATFTWLYQELYGVIALTKDEDLLIGHDSRSVWIRELAPGGSTLTINAGFPVNAVALSPDNQFLAYGGRGKGVSIAEWQSGGPGEVRLLKMSSIRAGMALQKKADADNYADSSSGKNVVQPDHTLLHPWQ